MLTNGFFERNATHGQTFAETLRSEQRKIVHPDSYSIRMRGLTKNVDLLDLVKSFTTRSNEYLLAHVGVDTAENEPLEVWR